jgi:hypothetical protein
MIKFGTTCDYIFTKKKGKCFLVFLSAVPKSTIGMIFPGMESPIHDLNFISLNFKNLYTATSSFNHCQYNLSLCQNESI